MTNEVYDIIQMKEGQKRNVHELYKPPAPEDSSKNYCKLATVIFIASIFIALEIIGGTIAHSIAIISDAIHLVSDVLGFAFSFIFLYLSKKGMNEKISFGYHRMELIGALANIFIIWFMVIFIIYGATERIINKEFVEKPAIMLITSIAGVLINVILYNILHGGDEHSHGLLSGHDHDHSDLDSHDDGEKDCDLDHEHSNNCYLRSNPNIKSKKHICDHKHEGHNHQGHNHEGHNHQGHDHQGHNHEGHNHQSHNHQGHNHQGHNHQGHNHEGHKHDHDDHQGHDHGHGHSHESIGMKAALLHALSDLIQSVGVVISALIIYFYGSDHGGDVTQWNAYHLFDPIATYVFSILSLIATLPIIQNCYYLMMESTPAHINLDQLRGQFQKLEGVSDIHDIHVWDLKPGKTIIIAHVLAKKNSQRLVLTQLTDKCRKLRIYHSTFQVQQQQHKQNNDYIRCHHDIH